MCRHHNSLSSGWGVTATDVTSIRSSRLFLRCTSCLEESATYGLQPGPLFVGICNPGIPMYCVSKNAPTLASCRPSFDKYGLILTIFGQQHQHTLKMICIFNFPYPFTFTYFICFNTCGGNDAKQRVFQVDC